MIIGLSGKINSGKDFAGNIITNLIYEKIKYSNTKDKLVWNNDLKNPNYLFPSHPDQCDGFEIKKFATKLKQITALIIGCNPKDLEDRNFKDSVLPKEWNRLNFPVTVREALQRIGTNALRRNFNDLVWVNALFADYQRRYNPSEFNSYEDAKLHGKDIDSKWIITDVRFPDEVKAIKDRDGIVIRLNRLWRDDEAHVESTHESETALDDYKGFDYIFNVNSGDIVGMVDIARTVLKERDIL